MTVKQQAGECQIPKQLLRRRLSATIPATPIPAPSAGVVGKAARSIRNIKVDTSNPANPKVTGEAWGRVKVRCLGNTLLDFDGKLFDFTIDKNGGTVEKTQDVGCAHVHLRLTYNGVILHIHWDITGCKNHIPGDGRL